MTKTFRTQLALYFIAVLGLTLSLGTAALASQGIDNTRAPAETALAEQSQLQIQAHRATYVAKIKKGISISGTATRELIPEQSNWRYRFDVDSAPADIKESSWLSIEDNEVSPIRYRYSREGLFIRDKKRDIEFRKEAQRVLGKNEKGSWSFSSDENLLDRLSYQLQLTIDVALGKKEMLYRVAHKGRIEEERFAVSGEEEIMTALGKQSAIVVKKVRDNDSKRETLLWFSKTQPMLLLKMTQKEKDGEEYEIHIQSYDLL